eukprot:2407411-Rhodomonas_salina.1
MGQRGTMCCDDQAARITVLMGRQTGLEVAAISMGVTAVANLELSSCRTGRTGLGPELEHNKAALERVWV